MKKIKVAYVVHGLGAEGISSFTCNLMSKLDMNKFDVTVIMAVDKDGDVQKREAEIAGYGVKILRTCDLYNAKYIKKHLKMLKQYLMQYGPFDVMHANMDLLNGLNLKVAKKVGIKTRICHSHKSFGGNIQHPLKSFFVKSYRNIMKRKIKKYGTDLIGCSDLANTYMYGDSPSTVIINGIDTNKFLNATVDITRYKTDLGISPAKKVLAIVARIVEIKNPLFVVETVKYLSKQRNDFIFMWVGIGEFKEKMEEKIIEYGLQDYFLFTGVRQDVANILKCVDIFLLPSYYEGLPISVLEAQCSGCNCILSDTVTRQVDGGKCTFLPIDETGPKIWANKINELLDKEQRTPIAEDALRKFDIQTMADKISSFYKKT